jgi:hypothetical protein
MRPITTLTLSATLACGPLAPPLDANTTASSATSDTDATPTTIPPVTPTTTTSIAETTSQDPTTLATTTFPTTGAVDFIAKPDGGSTGIECNTFTQNCPVGQKCVPWVEGGGGFWNAAKCVEVTGDGAPGDPCFAPEGGVAGIDDCALGAFCWDVDATNHGTCIGQCTGSADAPICPPKASCAIAGDGVINLCFFGCDPLIQDCKGDELCIPQGDSFLCVLDASGEMGALNDPCEFANGCDKGLLCLNTASASIACQQGSQGCCQPFCEFPGSPCPNPDQQCLQWFDPMQPIPEGHEDVGVCAIPA